MSKFNIADLNIFGGEKTTFSSIHAVGTPQTPEYEQLYQDISGIFERNWLTNSGPVLQAFEQAICDYLQVKHCIAVCNGTMALMLALKALELQGEVIVPSFTFPATVHALEWCGLKPVFCDVDPRTHNLAPHAVAEKLTPATSAILGVHLWGQACAPEALSELAQAHQLALIYDAAHAFACQHRGEFIGALGEAEVFSFHATKLFHSLEGGAIVTQSDALASVLRQLNNFGFQDGKAVRLGINGKMNEISAAVGLHNLKFIHQIISHNQSCYTHYQEGLRDIPGVRLLELTEELNFQYIVLEIHAEYGLERNQLKQILSAENILAKPYFDPVHLSAPYRESSRAENLSLPVTEKLAQQVLVMPTGQQMDEKKIARVCELISDIQDHAGDIARRLQAH